MTDRIQKLFVVLEACGVRPPKLHATKHGLRAAHTGYTVALSELTDDEVAAAAEAYVKGPNPFWPTPGQLLELVPGIAEAEASWRKVEFGAPLSLLEHEVAQAYDEPRQFRQAYRRVLELWKNTPPDERRARDARGTPLLALSPRIRAELPRLLTDNQENHP